MPNLKSKDLIDIASGVAGDIVKYGAQTALVKVIVKQVMAALILKLPFLSFGPLSYMASFLLEKLVSFIVENSIIGLNMKLADLKIDIEVSEVNRLVEKAKEVKDDPEELKKVEDELIKASRDLITLLDKPRLLS